MPNQDLVEYIKSHLSSTTRKELTKTLLEMGWHPYDVEEAFDTAEITSVPAAHKHAPTNPAPEGEGGHITMEVIEDASGKQPVKKKKSYLKGISLGLALLIVSLGGTVGAAEAGFLPAASRLYRTTSLPLLWKASTANAGITGLQVLEATSKVKKAEAAMEVSFSVRALNSAQPVSADTIQSRVKLLADAATFKPDSDIRSFAAIESDSELVPSSLETADYLPISLTLKQDFKFDEQKNFYGKFDIDLASVIEKVSYIKEFLPNIPNNITVEAQGDPGNKKIFARSNVLPYLNAEDKGKWLQYPIEEQEVQQYTSWEDDFNKLGDAEKKQIQDVLTLIVKDMGVERLEGSPVAHYQITVDKAAMEKIQNLPSMKQYASVFIENEVMDSTLSADIWVGQFDHRLKKSQAKMIMAYGKENIVMEMDSKVTIRYDLPGSITPPSASQVINEPAETYLVEAFTKQIEANPINDKATSNQMALNAGRKNDIVQLGKMMEAYIAENNRPPSTNNEVVRMDDPANPLSAINFFDTLYPLKDPEPEKYYYGYKSNGQSYQFTAVLISDGDDGKVVGMYKLQDGDTSQEDY